MQDVFTPRQSRRAPVPKLVIDPATLTLDDSRVVVRHREDGGYVCVGFGTAAGFLRSIDHETDDAKYTSIHAAGGEAVSFLDQLTSAIALAKAYNEEERRGEDGRWTSGGISAVAAAITTALYGNSAQDAALGQLGGRVLGALPALPAVAGMGAAAGAGVTAVFAGTLFFHTSSTSEGTLPDAPDFSYRFDQEAGELTVSRQHEDGTSEVVYRGRYGADGAFRDADGNPVGRFLGSNAAIDVDAIRGYETRAKSRTREQSDDAADADAVTTQSEPKLCPDPEPESIAGRKEPALRYQTQITGLPPGVAFYLVDPATGRYVSYDGCVPVKNGQMLEAKGSGYLKMMTDPNNWFKWYRGVDVIKDQIERQSRAAIGRDVDWHFAEEQTADYFRRYVASMPGKFSNIHVYYTPAR